MKSNSLPLLVFGGPYSNLQATVAMRREAVRRGFTPDRIVCTGDVVAYCANPEETVTEIRDWGIQVIQGNCEQQLAAGAVDCGCGFEEGTACDRLSRSWYEFAGARLSNDSRNWMARLPDTLVIGVGGMRVRFVHGGVSQINRFIFESQTDAIAEELDQVDEDVVVGGHCGIPFVAQSSGKTWLNAGVIGMPANDGTPNVWFSILSPEEAGLRLTNHRLAYDSAAAAAALRQTRAADAYAVTLESGLWPSLEVLPPTERRATGIALRPLDVLIAIPVPA